MTEFDFPKRVFSPNLLFGSHADTRRVRSLVERWAQRGAERGSNPFEDADELSRALESTEWGDAVVRYPPLPDKPFVPYARGYYLFLRGETVSRRGAGKKRVPKKAKAKAKTSRKKRKKK